MGDIPQEWVEKGAHVLLHGHPLLNKTESDRLARAVLAAVLPDVLAERDALAATVERVRALCDEWAEPTHYPAVALRLRAALDRPPHPEGTG